MTAYKTAGRFERLLSRSLHFLDLTFPGFHGPDEESLNSGAPVLRIIKAVPARAIQCRTEQHAEILSNVTDDILAGRYAVKEEGR